MTHRVTQLEAAAVSEIGPRVRVTQLFVQPLAADKSLPIRDTQLFSQLVLADKTLPVRVTQFFVHTIQSIDQTIRPGVTGLQPAIPVEDNGFIGVDSVAGFAEPFQPPIFDRESNPFRPDLAQPVSPRLPGMINDLQPQRESLSLSGPASAIGVASIPTFESPVPRFENPMTPPAPAGGSPDRVGVIVDMMRESQEAQRQVHEKNQAGDTTTPWEFLTRVSNEQLFTPGSIGRFYHDDYGMIQARYVKFAQMDSSLQWVNAPVGRLAASPEFGWEVTNRFDKSSAFLAEGIIASYVMPKNGQYGWVTISGANHTRIFLRDTPRPTQGQNVSWWGPEAVTGTRAGKVLGYIVGNKGLTRLEPGMLYICVGGVTRTEIESWFTESFEQIQTIFDEIAERLEAIEGSDNPSTLAQLTADVEKLRADLTMESQARASAIRGLANQISALDFVSSVDLASFESGLRAYIDQQDAVLAGQAGNALARANAAYALAEAIPDYRSEITRLDAGIAAALSNIATLLLNYLPQGLLADRPVTPTAAPNVSVFWFSTDTNTLSVYDFTDSVWVDITGGGGGASDLDDLTDVDTSTTPPVADDVLTFDGSLWVPRVPVTGAVTPWTVVGSYDFAVNGLQASITSGDLSQFDELWVQFDAVDTSSDRVVLLVSTDGTNFFNGGTDYADVDTGGAISTNRALYGNNTFTGVAATSTFHIPNLSAPSAVKHVNIPTRDARQIFRANTNPIIRVRAVSADALGAPTGNLNGGRITMLARASRSISGRAPFRGARVYMSSAFSLPAVTTAEITGFNTEEFDTGGWWGAAGQGYFTIPPGVEYIDASLKIVDTDIVAGQFLGIINLASSTGTILGVLAQTDVDSPGGDTVTVNTGPVKVTPGQRIVARAFADNARTLDSGQYGCTFAIHDLTQTGNAAPSNNLPTAAAFPVVAGTFTENFGSRAWFASSFPGPTSGISGRGFAVSGSTSWRANVYGETGVNFNLLGIWATNGTRYLLFGTVANNGANVAVENWTNRTTFSANVVNSAMAGRVPDWFRMDYDAVAGNISCFVSYDGENWVAFGLPQNWLGTGVTQMGFGASRSNANRTPSIYVSDCRILT